MLCARSLKLSSASLQIRLSRVPVLIVHRSAPIGKSLCWAMGDFDVFSKVAVDSAKEAGSVILAAFNRTKNVELKGAVDLVTETDKMCEEIVLNNIKTAFPQHKFIGTAC